MSLYVDSSALLKRYVDEADSDECEQILLNDQDWTTARVTFVEVRRNLSRLLDGRDLMTARESFTTDWERTNVVEVDAVTCGTAATIAETTGARTLDALHLAAALRALGGSLTLVTYDRKQSQAARQLGWTVLGS